MIVSWVGMVVVLLPVKSLRAANSPIATTIASSQATEFMLSGGWWLVAGGWWLVAGGWWLVPIKS
jgi:hypothetical protein